MNLKKATKTALKVSGALLAATGIVAVGAVVASGAAAGSMVEGFKAAGKAMKKMLGDKDETDVASAKSEPEEDIFEEEEVVEPMEAEETLVEEEIFAEPVVEEIVPEDVADDAVTEVAENTTEEVM